MIDYLHYSKFMVAAAIFLAKLRIFKNLSKRGGQLTPDIYFRREFYCDEILKVLEPNLSAFNNSLVSARKIFSPSLSFQVQVNDICSCSNIYYMHNIKLLYVTNKIVPIIINITKKKFFLSPQVK